MVASQAKTQTPCKIRRPKPGSKTEAILTLTATTPARSVEIAESTNTSTAHVAQVLKRYGITPNRLESYKNHRAEVMAGMQLKILKHVSEERLQKASVNNLAYAYMQFNQAERLERGQATALIGHGFLLSAPLQEAVDRLIERLAPVDNPVDNPLNG